MEVLRLAFLWILLFFYANIMKTCLYNFDPIKPYFYIVKLGFTGVYIIFLNFAQKHRLWEDCGYSLELPRQGSSKEYPQSIFWLEIWKIEFLSENFQFLEVKFSTYLNRPVFVMITTMSVLDKSTNFFFILHNVIKYQTSKDTGNGSIQCKFHIFATFWYGVWYGIFVTCFGAVK